MQALLSIHCRCMIFCLWPFVTFEGRIYKVLERYFSPGNFAYFYVTHGGTQVYVRASSRDTSSSSPLSLAGKKKTFFFVSEESTAAILTRLGIGISGGALI